MSLSVADIGEAGLLERILPLLPNGPDLVLGAGDDCAAMLPPASPGMLLLMKTDAVVEGIHFATGTSGDSVGWKAGARCVSDMGAMGGAPLQALVSLALPDTTPVRWVEEFYAGIGRLAERFKFGICGGETTRSPSGISATVSMVGIVSREAIITRSTARTGDFIYVTGQLGGSINGHHLTFLPRQAEGSWLATHVGPSAMMDLSDGLAADLPRLCAASGVGFRLDLQALPLNPGCSVRNALADGEDYELIFTVAPGREPLLADWAGAFPNTRLTRIGSVVERECGERLDANGYDHFKQP